MKKFLLLALCLALLSGCAAQSVWETVDDELPAIPAGGMEDAYLVSIDVPDDAVAAAGSDDGASTCYEQPEGDYEISVQTLLCSGADSAVRRLSGFEPEQLDVLRTTRFGLPEYQFAWYASGDEGGRLCRADVLCDWPYSYTVTFSVREECAAAYQAAAQQVFESICLNAPSGF